MSEAWWGQEASPRLKPKLTEGFGLAQSQPQLHPDVRQKILEEARVRTASFTPDWTNFRADDAGYALLRLFSEQTEPVLQRLNRLPEKAFVEFLLGAGVKSLPPRPAKALLAFTAAPAAPQSVLVARGFQVSASAADGSGDSVIFETESSLYVAPVAITAGFVQEGNLFQETDVSDDTVSRWLPLGARPRVGSALLLGLTGDVVPRPSLTLGIQFSPDKGAPPPVASGGIEALPIASGALLRWEFFDGGRFETAEIIRDETQSLQQSGIVELRVPRTWRIGTPFGVAAEEPLRWLRLRLVHGAFDTVPVLSNIRLNMVPAVATRTIRDEVLEFVPGSQRRRMRLSQTPVLPDSLVLLVDEGETATLADPETGVAQDTPRRWSEVDALSLNGPDDRVYVLDAANGELLFGNGLNGAELPRGFRNISAQQYRVGTGAAGAVAAEEITTLVNSVPFLTEVINPEPATGGIDQETRRDTLIRGPQEIRTRQRAVTIADYALLALQAPGADVARAHAVSGLHPKFSGAIIPGVVTVFLVSLDRSDQAPVPDEGSLKAVSQYLNQEVAAAGVKIVAAPPRFHRVGVRASIVVSDGADSGATVRQMLRGLDNYFHPLDGGDDGKCWPFGGPILYNALVRRLLAQVPGLRAVSSLNLVVDGISVPACQDYRISANGLIWPAGHELAPIDEEKT